MTVREYARSLADQNLSQTEMYDKIRAYSNSLKSKEEVKKKDSKTADPSSESSDNTGSKSETGSSVPPGQTINRGDGYEYKFEIDPNDKSKGIYYTRKTGANEWTNASANNSTDELISLVTLILMMQKEKNILKLENSKENKPKIKEKRKQKL